MCLFFVGGYLQEKLHLLNGSSFKVHPSVVVGDFKPLNF